MKIIKSTFFALLLMSISMAMIAGTAQAADKKDFDPGYIIDDYVFYNSSAMDVNQIQRFLESKNPSCDYNGTQPATDWGYPNITHAQLAEYKRNGTNGFSQDAGFHAPPYRCLTHYTQSTPQIEASSGYCGALSTATRTAAQIINDVSKACGINPQVLIILLQKEQSLVTDSWPLDRQLRHATGFACPDTAPCDPAYEGFFYQVYNAARQFKVYQAFPNSYNYRAGRDNNIYWNPDLGRCGSSTVYIQNQATAALYIYTPYRPNQAALDNLYGLGDSCSSYGNRNFWRMFTDWFGSTKLSFTDIDTPRYMQIKNTTKRYDIQMNQTFGDDIMPGTQAFFVDKVQINNKWYARTEYAKNNNQLYGIAVDDIQDIPITAMPNQWISIPSSTKKIDPLRRKEYETISPMSATQIVDSITIEGTLYYRTAWEKTLNRTRFIPADSVEPIRFYPFIAPRGMVTRKETKRVNVQTGTIVSTVPKDTILYFIKQLNVDGTIYVQVSSDDNTLIAIAVSDLSEISLSSVYFAPLDTQRYMQTTDDTQRVSIQTGQPMGDTIPTGTQAFFTDKIFAYGQWYARTKYAADSQQLYGIPVNDIGEVPVSSISAYWVSFPAATKKVNPFTGEQFDTIQAKNATQVVDSVVIEGALYYRTAWEKLNGRLNFVPASNTEALRFYSFDVPRSMRTIRNTNKIDVQTGASITGIPHNTTLYFNQKLTVDGKLYAQAQGDNGTVYAILASDLGEL